MPVNPCYSSRRIGKGVLLAGGQGSRLAPLTLALNKHLLPVYDKPLIYYPLSLLIQAGIREVLLITTAEHRPGFERLLGRGEQWGMRLHYAVQPRPEGVPQALLIAQAVGFLQPGEPVALALGDNVLFGPGVKETLRQVASLDQGATVFCYPVRHPQHYGVVELGAWGEPVRLVEKPSRPRSRWAVGGLYFYDPRAVQVAAQLQPSPRGELEITDLNRWYLQQGQLRVVPLRPPVVWVDAGTPESLLRAGGKVAAAQRRSGRLVGSVEAEAFEQGWISAQALALLAQSLPNHYGRHLAQLAQASCKLHAA